MAKVHKLNGFDDLSLIDAYAARFSQDPDKVYNETSFGTIINFAIMWKEKSEFDERFNFVWHEVNSNPVK